MRLPAECFASLEDFSAWHAQNGALLRARALAEAASAPIRPGSCAPCLRAAVLEDGRCDCPDRLDAASRALLHAAVAEAGLSGWSRLRLVGPASAAFDRLAALAAQVVREGPAEVAVADPFTAAFLPSIRGALADGGCLLAPLRFDPRSRSDWNILHAARAAGFSRAEVLLPWSRELGYLHPIFLLKAVA